MSRRRTSPMAVPHLVMMGGPRLSCQAAEQPGYRLRPRNAECVRHDFVMPGAPAGEAQNGRRPVLCAQSLRQ